MKRVITLLSSSFAALWMTMILSFAFLCFTPNKLSKTELLDNCSGNPIKQLEDNAEDSLSVNEKNRILSSQMRNYFYNLRSHFGYNEKGSCGYIALGMMLTYYDSYYNDSLVPDNYDATANMSNLDDYAVVSSPGSIETPIKNEEYLSIREYTDTLINHYSDKSLHAKLVSIGNSLGYGLSTTPDIIIDVLKRYISNNEQASIDDWVINKYRNDNYESIVPGKEITYSDLMFDNIKSYLKMDIPVLVSIRNDYTGHVVLAYDYDEDEDVVYANFGWHSFAFHSNIFDHGYKYVRGYITMGSKNLHTHTNNYILDGEALCTCALPNHKHIYEYKSNNALTHSKRCVCGSSTSEKHRFTKFDIKSGYVICEDCSFKKLQDGAIILPSN